MIRTTKAATPWPLPWDSNTIFMLRTGDVIERGDLEAKLAELGGGRVYDFQLTEAFLAGVEALLPDQPEDVARIREVAEAFEALGDGERLPPEEQQLLDGVREAVKENWSPYRTLLSQAARRAELVPTLAFHWFCTGWQGKNVEGGDLPVFRAGMDGRVDIGLMGEISPLILRMAGQQAYSRLWATSAEGNSAPLLPSAKSRVRSKGTPTKAGSSAKQSTAKTPSQPRRRGRSRSSTSGSTAKG